MSGEADIKKDRERAVTLEPDTEAKAIPFH